MSRSRPDGGIRPYFNIEHLTGKKRNTATSASGSIRVGAQPPAADALVENNTSV
ncbi:MAG: hypothetical protein Q9211_003771 [Gyalolechia sp. 1 TL-2023]